jgi:hypothetical protein
MKSEDPLKAFMELANKRAKKSCNVCYGRGYTKDQSGVHYVLCKCVMRKILRESKYVKKD